MAEIGYRYTFGPSHTHGTVHYTHQDAAGVSQRVTRNSPETVLGTTSSEPDYIDPRHAEYDAMGSNTGLKPNFTIQYLPSEPPLGMETDTNFINGQIVNATQDGMRIPLSVAMNLINTGNIGGMLGLHERLLRQMSLPESIDVEWPPWEASDPISITINRDIFGVSFNTDWLRANLNPGRPRRGVSPLVNPEKAADVDHCVTMADVAQIFADAVVKAFADERVPLDINALNEFDRAFARHYVGRQVRGWSDALALSPVGPERSLPNRRAPVEQRGQRGFQSRFREPNEGDNKDQTHHFATFLSLGINSQETIASLHKNLTDYFNPGDYNLSEAALLIGRNLVKEPANLSRIGNIIKDSICN